MFQQFIVNGYTMMGAERLLFIRTHQKQLCCVKYNILKNPQHLVENANCGKCIILPSSFVGRRRYMDQLYFDEMAICSTVGFSDLFLTFTCKPYWPKIQRFVSALKLTAQDQLDIVTRIFKLKLEQL